ncbi:MAG: bifunctional chorismate mutase/prephenate dehydratase, partial [Clostridia bacterium]
DINDNSCNQTRFICIARELENAENANRISVAFNLPNECGALSALLATLADSGVSLSKIMSRPIPDTPWEYIFYADLEGNLENAALRGVLYQLRCETPSLILLGVYPESGAAQ